MDGWIKIHRKILDNPVITKDSDHLAVWIYLLLNATYYDYDVIFRGKRVTLRPGELLTGRKSIAKKLKMNESKVQRILKSFENEQQIEQQTSSKNRIISIKNWCMYQEVNNNLNNKRTTSEQQVNTNKNIKNIKNIYNIEKFKKIDDSLENQLENLYEN